MKNKFSFALFLVPVFAGCSIQQAVKPTTQFNEKQICIVENSAVRSTFLDAYKKSLTDKNYTVLQLSTASKTNECQITSTYTANWRWDLAMYMAYAEIKVYKQGNLIGEAKYDSTRGGGNLGKFIDADKKISELVNQLFPYGPGSAVAAAPASKAIAAQPDNRSLIGKWQYQAEKLSLASSCSTPAMISAEPGLETYSTMCNDAHAKILCEFGKCQLQLND